MKVSVVIPNYNGCDLLRVNLPKVVLASPRVEIIVVDDGSTDGSVKMLKHNFPDIKIVQKVRNSGFPSAVNVGIKASLGDLIMLINSDVFPQQGYLEELIPYFEDPLVFAVGCLQKSKEFGEIILRGRGTGKFHHGFLMHQRGEIDNSNTLWVSGGAGMFRKSIWEELGGLDTLYNPFYWEDIDLSYRALKSGYKIFFEHKSKVTHEYNQGIIRKGYRSVSINLYAYRNQILFVWLNIFDFDLIIQHLIYLPYHLSRSLITLNWVFILGLFLALGKLPQVLLHRIGNKKKSIFTDKKILNRFS